MPPRVDVMALSQRSTAVPKGLGHQRWQEIAPLTRNTKAAVSTPAQMWPPLILDNRRLATIICNRHIPTPRNGLLSPVSNAEVHTSFTLALHSCVADHCL